MKKNKGKKRAIEAVAETNLSTSEDETSSDSDAEKEIDSDEEIDEQNIDVEFEAFPPAETDFHGIKNLLLKTFLMLHVNVSEFTDLIISQTNVGSTIKIVDDEEDESFGIVSILSLQKFKEKDCVKELKKELLAKFKDSSNEDCKKLESILNEKNVGLLFNERFINIPPQIAVPFHKSLRDEVEEEKTDDKSFKFDYLLLISKTLRPTKNPLITNGTVAGGSSSSSSGSGSSKKKKKVTDIKDEIEYTNFEEEIFCKASKITFNYEVTQATGLAVAGDWDITDQHMKTFRTVMLVPTKQWSDIIDEIESMVK